MKQLTSFFVLFLSVAFLSNAIGQGAASTSQKLGYISIQELVTMMPETKKADSTLQAFQKDLESTYADLLAEYKTKDSTFRADSLKLSSTTKDLKKNDLMRLVQQIQTFQQGAEETMQKKQQELLNPIRAAAVEAIQRVAQRNGYAHVIEKSLMYYYTPADDLLPVVKKELNIKDQTKPAAAPAKK